MNTSVWTMDYRHDRRVHRHRCQACHCIVNAGDRVWMVRVNNKVTRVVHVDGCAESLADPLHICTALELMTAHAVMHRDPSLDGGQALERARNVIAKAKCSS